MKSPITKLAVAAVIIVAVVIGINEFIGPSVAFADVVRPFLTANTATFKVTIEVQGGPTQTGDGMFKEPGRMRQSSPEGVTTVVDLQLRKVVVRMPAQKRAIVHELINVQEDPGQFNMFEEIRRRILEAQENEDECVEFLGENEIEGRAAIGYHVQKAGIDITIWADAETKIPIRMENTIGTATTIISDIVFNVPLEDSLFDLDIPEEYTVHTLQVDCSVPYLAGRNGWQLPFDPGDERHDGICYVSAEENDRKRSEAFRTGDDGKDNGDAADNDEDKPRFDLRAGTAFRQ
ncbi:MAG: LolA family protein [Planctomycetota bacterium]|jgi:outer membrane lipoprotein-sorting protein